MIPTVKVGIGVDGRLLVNVLKGVFCVLEGTCVFNAVCGG